MPIDFDSIVNEGIKKYASSEAATKLIEEAEKYVLNKLTQDKIILGGRICFEKELNSVSAAASKALFKSVQEEAKSSQLIVELIEESRNDFPKINFTYWIPSKAIALALVREQL